MNRTILGETCQFVVLTLLASIVVADESHANCEQSIPADLFEHVERNEGIKHGYFLYEGHFAKPSYHESPDPSRAGDTHFIVDRNRNYFYLEWEHEGRKSTISSIVVTDECLATDKGVSPGDNLSMVLSAYPDASLGKDDKTLRTGTLDLYANGGKLKFSFGTDSIKDALNNSPDVNLGNPLVRGLTVKAITVYR